MGKRFGRNQKNRLRKQIDNQKQQIEMTDGLLHHIQLKNDYLEKKFQRIIGMIGEIHSNSVALDPKKARGDAGAYDGRYRIGVEKKLRPTLYGDSLNRMSLETVDLFELQAIVEESHVHFGHYVHLVLGNEHEWTYFISKKALMVADDETVLKRIIPDIARRLLTGLKDSVRKTL
jgi:hypothetical protein